MKDFIVFDLETNGLQGSSVLSISALRIRFIQYWKTFFPIASYNRFYHIRPGEQINEQALKVHKLSNEEIEKQRQGVDYPSYFADDVDNFGLFRNDCYLVVGHGIEFDLSFLPAGFFKKYYCTMKANTNPGEKWPKLSTLAYQYGVPYSQAKLHQSDYDVGITFQIFQKMVSNGKVNNSIFY